MEKKNKPLVSIMIPTYNRPKLFEQTLQSALNQDYENFEVIVNDNSSNDDTEQLIQKYLADPRLRYYRNHEAKTKEENFIPFEQQAKGEYLQWCMDDDMLAPGKLSKMVKCFAEHPEVTLITSQRGVVNGEGMLLKQWKAPVEIKAEYEIFAGDDVALTTLCNATNFIGEPSAVLFRRRDLTHHYWRAESRGYLAISDIAMWLELLERGDIAIFRDPLSYFRRHEGQEGAQGDVILLSRLEWIRLNRDYYQRQAFPYTRDNYKSFLEHIVADAESCQQLKGQATKEMWHQYEAELQAVKEELDAVGECV